LCFYQVALPFITETGPFEFKFGDDSSFKHRIQWLALEMFPFCF